MFRVAWWLLLAWAVGAAVLTALDALHFSSDEVLDHLIWASALYAVVAWRTLRSEESHVAVAGISAMLNSALCIIPSLTKSRTAQGMRLW